MQHLFGRNSIVLERHRFSMLGNLLTAGQEELFFASQITLVGVLVTPKLGVQRHHAQQAHTSWELRALLPCLRQDHDNRIDTVGVPWTLHWAPYWLS